MKTSSYLGILISLSILLFPASSIKAEDGDLALLSKSETWQILNGVQKEFISNKNPLEFINLNGEQQAAISTLRSLVREEFLNFLPAFISTETVKVFLQVGKQLVASPTSLGELLEKVESFTVKEAVKIGMGWFVQNEIKISSGILEGKQLGITFQYILTYQEIDNDHANVAMQFYSPDSFKPPRPTASLTMGVPYFADELPKDGKIRPFVVHAQTKIEKIGLGWVVDSSADTKITVEFPEKVPRLQLAKEWPYPLEEQKINFLNAWTTAKRVLEYLKSVGSEAVGKAADFVHKVQELAKGVIDYTSQFIGRGGAGLVDPFSKESQQLDHIESQLTLAVEALEAKEDQVKLRVKLSPTKDEVKNEVQPVENLVGLSFPQEEILQQLQPDPAPKRSLELNEIKDEVKEGPIPQEVVPELNQKLSQAKDNEQILRLAKDEVELSPTKFCTVDPSRGPALSTVMFSEIAWMGSINSANDEWIKLKNISNAEVKLEGWQVQDADNQIQIALGKDHRVFSQDSFILERTNDDSLPGIQAHVIYTGALNNTNEAVYLFDEKCVLRDKVVASPNWLAGDNVSRKPMARNNDLGWYTQGSGSSASIALTNGSPNAGSTPTAGGLPPKTYPKILISEVQTAGVSSQTEEFVELYNPTNAPVDLTDWYVQKKMQGADSFSTFASKNILSGKTIQASSYFLIAREGSSFAPSADVVTSYSLGDNNTLALKNPNGEIVDKVAWGDVQDAESTSAPNPLAGQSLNRIWDTANQTYYDRDNNSIDFALHNPVSPKAVNPTPTPPPPPSPSPSPPSQDTTSPSVPGIPVATTLPTDRTPTWTWSASTDAGSGLASEPYIIEWSADSSFQSGASSAGATVNSFTHSVELTDGTWYARVKAKDAVNNESQYSLAGSIIINTSDTTIPVVSFNALALTQLDVYFTISWSATDPAGDVSPSGVQNIFLEYSITPSATGVFVQYQNSGVWTNWQQGSTGKLTLSPATTSLNLRTQDSVSYTFQVKAKDVAGNESIANTASTAVSLAKTIVINEVAWAGTKAQSTDEWLELFNTTTSSVDLTGWKITSSDSGGPEITLSGAIAASGFYLIERTDDLATTVTAQLVASFGNGLSNTTCETLYLYNAQNTVVDQTTCKSQGAWSAGVASPDYISMERVVPITTGSSVSNWANNNLIQYNNKDVGNNWINGTPGTTNSTATSPTTITDTTLRFDEFSTLTLTNLGSPYVTTASITIPAGKTLIVEPGVQVKFKDNTARLTVQGTLKAQGTQASGITFTVTDGGAIWCGVKVAATSTGSQLDYVTIDKAQSTGSSFCNESVNYAMYVDSSSVAINNSVIQTGAYHRKLYLKNSNSPINALTVSGATLNADSVGIYIDGGSPTISNSTISNNSIGIFVGDLSNNPTIQNNTFTGNTYAVKMSSVSAALSGNAATGNTYNGVFVEGITQANTTWQKDAIPYIVNKFTVSAGTTLTLQAGVAVKFINTPSTESEITVQGTLITQGTAENPVVFTAAADNTVGGSNSYSGGGIKTSWKRIYIAPGSTGSQLTYVTLKYGGNTYYEAALYVKQSSVQVSNLTISNSVQSAIYSFSGTITGSNVTLSNSTYGFHIQTGDCPALSAVTITGTVLHPSSSPCSF